MSAGVEAFTRLLAIMKAEAKLCTRSGWRTVTISAAATSALAACMTPPARGVDRSIGLSIIALCVVAAAVVALLQALARAGNHASAWERATRARALPSTAAALAVLFLHTVITSLVVVAAHRLTAHALGADAWSPSIAQICVVTGSSALPLGALLASTVFARMGLVLTLTLWALGSIVACDIFAGAFVRSVDRVPRDPSVAGTHLDVLLFAGSLTAAGLMVTLAARERPRG